MKLVLLKALFATITSMILLGANAQDEYKAISFQGILKQNENLLVDQAVFFRLGLYSDTTETTLYEELQDTLTNDFALFNLYLGNGTSTGDALTDNFNEVFWSDPIWLKIEYRLLEADDFTLLGTRKFQALAFAMYADYAAGENVGVNDLFDVSNDQLNDYILKWDGEKWLISPGAVYAWNTINSNFSTYADTALIALSLIDPVPTDSVSYSNWSDSVSYSMESDSAYYSTYSIQSDIAVYANQVINAWNINGNEGFNQLGTTDSTDLILNTNSNDVIRIKAEGRILVNQASDYKADLQIKGTVAFQGIHQAFTLDSTFANAYYWEPKKSSSVIGSEMTTYFVDTLGRYSFAGGRKSVANSYSFAWGDSCLAIGNNGVSIGKGNKSFRVGIKKDGTGMALGLNNQAGRRSHAIGINNILQGKGAKISIGKDNIIYDEIITSTSAPIIIGHGIVMSSTSDWAISIGRRINSQHSSTIMLTDNANLDTLYSTANHQFLVRAAGGSIFYSDSSLSSGVSLAPGSGSWSMLSDRTKKNNILDFNWSTELSYKLKQMEIYNWNYKSQDKSVIHLGPTAQKFNGSFGFNEDLSRVNGVDIDGLTLSGILYLFNQFESVEVKLNNLNVQLTELKDSQEEMNALLKYLSANKKGGTK